MSNTDISVAMPVRHCCNLLRQRLPLQETCTGLVVGCGNGNEAVYLGHALADSRVIGLDVEPGFSPLAQSGAEMLVADAKRLPLPDASFDFAAAFHSLEHVGNPREALSEIHRVLRPGGWFYVGVPNKMRAIGYLGSFDASLYEKFVWNLKDYRARLTGRFENEFGAHAGFEGNELLHLLRTHFSEVQVLTVEYFRIKYGGRMPRLVLDFLLSPGVINFSAPAHYVLCRR